MYTNFLAIGSQATVTCSPPWNKEPDYVLDGEAFARRLFSMPFHWPERSLDGLWHTVPVDVFELARRYGLEIHDRFLPDEVGGIMHKFEGKSYLYLNRIHQPERGRFTVAHELAHHLAHRTGIYMSSPFGSKPQERLADEIAA